MRILLQVVIVLSVVQLKIGDKRNLREYNDAAPQQEFGTSEDHDQEVRTSKTATRELPTASKPHEVFRFGREYIHKMQIQEESPFALQLKTALQKSHFVEEALERLQKAVASSQEIQSVATLQRIQLAAEALKGLQTALVSPQGLQTSVAFKKAIRLTEQALKELRTATEELQTSDTFKQGMQLAEQALVELKVSASPVMTELQKSPLTEYVWREVVRLVERLGKNLRDNEGLFGFSTTYGISSVAQKECIKHYEEAAQKIDKMKNIYEIVKKVWDDLDLKGKSDSDKIKNMIDVVSERLENYLPEFAHMSPMEDKSVGKVKIPRYLCGCKGIVRDLRDIKLVDRNVKKNENGFKVEIDFTVKGLQFIYTVFYIKIAGLKKKGKLFIDFKKNNLTLVLQVPSIAFMLPKMVFRNCMVTITDFQVSRLDFKRSYLISDQPYRWVRKVLNKGINVDLNKNQEAKLKNTFEDTILILIHIHFTTNSGFFCKDRNILKKLNKRRVEIELPSFSNDFKKYCGTEYYFRPGEEV